MNTLETATQLPRWEWVGANRDEKGGYLSCVYVPGENGRLVAKVLDPDHDASLRNARLLCAAPELLEALETAGAWSIDTRGDDFPYHVVEAAIKKATGR